MFLQVVSRDEIMLQPTLLDCTFMTGGFGRETNWIWISNVTEKVWCLSGSYSKIAGRSL